MSVATVLLVAALAFRQLFSHAVSREFDRSMVASAELARGFYTTEVAEYGLPEPTAVHISAELQLPDRRLEFVRPDGRVVTSPGSSRSLALAGPTRRHDEPLDPKRAPGWRIRVLASTLPLARPLRQVDELLLLAIPLGVLVAGVVGWWLGGRTLRPVAQMAAATEHVTSGSGTRLPVDNPSDELGRLGVRFNGLLDRLDATLAQQRAFLADAAHELRTPLSRTLSGVELALLDDEPSAAHVAALRRAQVELGLTGRLVDELLQLARMDAVAGAGPGMNGGVRLSLVYLDDVAGDALAAWRAPAQQADVRLTQSAVEEAQITGDHVLVERLIGVLVDNAIRYTPAGGTVDVRVMCEDRAAVLAVADTGIGITTQDCVRVTERFFRGATARERRPDGNGLGLAIAHSIAEALGATLTLRPVPSGGTIARVAFPRTDAVKQHSVHVRS